jgi:hypothetical protein
VQTVVEVHGAKLALQLGAQRCRGMQQHAGIQPAAEGDPKTPAGGERRQDAVEVVSGKALSLHSAVQLLLIARCHRGT